MANIFNVIPTLETSSVDHKTNQNPAEVAHRDTVRITKAISEFSNALGEGSRKILTYKTGDEFGKNTDGSREVDPAQVLLVRAHSSTILEDYKGQQEAAIKITLADKAKTDLLIPVTPNNISTFENAMKKATAAATKLNGLLDTQSSAVSAREELFDAYQGPIHQVLKTELKSFIR